MTRQVKRVRKYHYHYEKICDETDVIYTRCYCCGELKPSGTEYFRKEKDPKRERDFRPLCKECANKNLREYLQNRAIKKQTEQQTISPKEVRVEELFTEEDKEKLTLESKIQKLLDYLGL